MKETLKNSLVVHKFANLNCTLPRSSCYASPNLNFSSKKSYHTFYHQRILNVFPFFASPHRRILFVIRLRNNHEQLCKFFADLNTIKFRIVTFFYETSAGQKLA